MGNCCTPNKKKEKQAQVARAIEQLHFDDFMRDEVGVIRMDDSANNMRRHSYLDNQAPENAPRRTTSTAI